MNNKFFAISIDSLIKTFSVVDAGESVFFQISPEDRPSIETNDCVIGFVGHGIDEFRMVFEVQGAEETSLTMSKKIERDCGVPGADFAETIMGQLASLSSPGSIVELPDSIGREILDRLYGRFDLNTEESTVVNSAYQLITYGAPGVGKSHKIDKRTNESNSIRVTFHPDTDYASFVGAYKPTMESTEKGLLTLQELGTVLQSLKDRGETRPEQKLGAEFWRSFEKLTPADVKSILKDESMYAEVMKGVAVGEYLARIENGGKQIVYSFVPQAFMKAYVEAWRRYTNAGLQSDAKTYYLVIEEINRGNCAQIFGDLFQLLDRADNGFSAYAITPDDDIQKFLETDKDYKLADISLSEDIKKVTEAGEKVIATAADIKAGKKLVLPPNLCIWATMNTSDQSLFPIDSAFKRRWDWEYVPIKDESKGWYVKVGEEKYKWWSFLAKINTIVFTETQSADKQLGYFFVKLPKGQKEIDLNKFVNKVAFYLWNDVFKDCDIREDALKLKDDSGKAGDPIKFTDFFESNASTFNEKVVKDMLDGLGVEKETAAE